MFGRLEVYGNPLFSGDVVGGLQQLKSAFPYGFGLIQRYIRCVVESDTPNRAKGSGIGVVCQKVTREGSFLTLRIGMPHFLSGAQLHCGGGDTTFGTRLALSSPVLR